MPRSSLILGYSFQYAEFPSTFRTKTLIFFSNTTPPLKISVYFITNKTRLIQADLDYLNPLPDNKILDWSNWNNLQKTF